jgi:hypothetical protein
MMTTPQSFPGGSDDLPILRSVARASRAQARLSGVAPHGEYAGRALRFHRIVTLALGFALLFGLSKLILDSDAWAGPLLHL